MSENKELETFYRTVVEVITQKRATIHHPTDSSCLRGLCGWCKPRFNWKAMRELVASIWNHGPDVDDNWKRAVERGGFRIDADELHDILIGIFIGSVRAKKPRPTQVYSDWICTKESME